MRKTIFQFSKKQKKKTKQKQKRNDKMIFSLAWSRRWKMDNTVFFPVKNLMEICYLLINVKFLFWTFQEWEIRFFFIEKSDEKMIFVWSFLAFCDIPGLGKYCFSCSVLMVNLWLNSKMLNSQKTSFWY